MSKSIPESLALASLTVVREYMKQLNPPDAGVFFSGAVVGLTVAAMDDVKWSEMRTAGAAPCGELDCNCHIFNLALFDAADGVRDEALETMGIATQDDDDAPETECDRPDDEVDFNGTGLPFFDQLDKELKRSKPDAALIRKLICAANQAVAEIIIDLMCRLGDRDAGMTIMNIIGLSVTGAPQDRWDGIVKAAKEPCGQPGCKCHDVRSTLMDAITLVREDQKA